jgi:MFS family permease
MSDSAAAEPVIAPRGLGFLLLYALAWGGGVIAYVPLLTLILPVKIETIAPDDKVALLSLTTLLGAVVASAMNVLIGMASDHTVMRARGRRPWVALGLILTLISYAVLHAATTATALVIGVMLFQAALNLMLAPLSAVPADEIPDAQKGLVGGLMGAVYTFGALAGMVVTASPWFSERVQFIIAGALMTAGILPFLLLSRTRGPIVPASVPMIRAGGRRKRNLVRIWIARLLVQISGSIFFAYLLFYFETVDWTGLSFGGAPFRSGDVTSQVAWLAGSVTLILAPLAIATGRLSDAMRSRKPFLVITAAMITVGLLLMALLPQWASASAGYVLFASGTGLFLALQSAYAMQLLITPEHRGRDMGVLNLTNTIPALIAPSMAYLMAGKGDFTLLLLVLAALAAVAMILALQVRDEA